MKLVHLNYSLTDISVYVGHLYWCQRMRCHFGQHGPPPWHDFLRDDCKESVYFSMSRIPVDISVLKYYTPQYQHHLPGSTFNTLSASKGIKHPRVLQFTETVPTLHKWFKWYLTSKMYCDIFLHCRLNTWNFLLIPLSDLLHLYTNFVFTMIELLLPLHRPCSLFCQ